MPGAEPLPQRAHVLVHGRVQGVGFRISVRAYAHRHQLNAWVRNLDSGDVEAVFEGPAEDVRAAVDWCRKGPSGSYVTQVDVFWDEPAEGLRGVEIRSSASRRAP